MAKKWTVRERKEHYKEKYHETRRKIFVLVAGIIIYAILLGLLYYSLVTGAHPALLLILILAMIILAPLVIFILDVFFFEYM